MDPDFLHAINGDWDSLLAAMRESRSLVHRTDSSGMSILHWTCLHQDIPTDVVIKVVFANPHAVQLRNDAGHLPIDLAIQAECGERILEILRAAYTGAAQEEEEEHLEPSAEIDFDQSYFHNVNNNNRHQQQSRLQYQQQQQQQHSLVSPQSNYHYRQQEQRNNNNYHAESPAHQMVMYEHHNQQQQQQRGRDNSYRDYPEEDDDDDRFSGRALHAPPPRHAPSTRSHRSSSASKFPQQHPDAKTMYSIYSNQTGAERDEIERERGRSHSSSTSVFNSMVLTEQRLQQREHDLISYATEGHHHDIFDPSLGSADINRLLQQPAAVGGEWGKPLGDSGGGAGSVTNGKKPRAQSSFPPRWKQSRNCHVCMAQWTMMKRRHHCRNCGQSVCGAHSTNRVALPKFGLMDPQRICDKCFLSGHHMASVLPVGSGSFGIGSIASSNTSYHQQQQQQPKQPSFTGR